MTLDIKRRLLAAILCALILVIHAPAARAQSVADFYRGKTVRIIIGTSLGGAYGVFSQLASRHIGRFIPGSPAVIVQSMPGAGGLVSLNHLSSAAPRDGSVITLIHVTVVQEGLFNSGASFDPDAFQWIGRLASLEFLGLASKKSGVRSLDDARKREVVVGAPGLNNVPAQSPLILNRIAGTKFKLISGYNGTGQTFIALERGEVDLAVSSMDGIRALHWDKLKSGEFVPVFAQAGRRLKDFPSVPTLLELSNNDVEKAFLNVFSVTAEIGRALATPPGIPSDRLEALRKAFDAMIVDPAFKADVEKLRIQLDPMPGAALGQVVAQAVKMTPDTRAKARAFYDELFKGIK
jgi:tripartite-type tricarboxylate transporter receptor subunit TctC